MSNAESMKIFLNGKEQAFPVGATVAEVVDAVGAVPGCAVALNSAVVPRSTWETATVEEGDRLEMLSPAPGG